MPALVVIYQLWQIGLIAQSRNSQAQAYTLLGKLKGEVNHTTCVIIIFVIHYVIGTFFYKFNIRRYYITQQ